MSCRGEVWHLLCRGDFSQVDFKFDVSPELWDLIKSMMCAAPALRISTQLVNTDSDGVRVRHTMQRMHARHGAVIGATPLSTGTDLAEGELSDGGPCRIDTSLTSSQRYP